MIEYIYQKDKEFRLISKLKNKEKDNLFTVIIGKNGTGKSRLLKDIVYSTTGHEDRSNIKKVKYHNKKNHEFTKVISVSTNPFDKFPWLEMREDGGIYNYLGLKDLSSINTGKSFLKK
ncbi:hypothetical protein C9426_28525 [Serratia sp. S1B]|nr:hypothetical protein C9426_28525 [Serratia sp. S1B]